MNATAEGVHTLNSLLRGELAATETYQQAMDKMQTIAGAAELRRIRDEHRDAANIFREHVRQHGGKPDQSSGAWGVWAKMVEGAAKVFGTTTALTALKTGEEQGAESYEEALEDGALPLDCKNVIRSTLLRTREHISTLDRLIKTES